MTTEKPKPKLIEPGVFQAPDGSLSGGTSLSPELREMNRKALEEVPLRQTVL